ncbi:MAG: 30S ribosome-binding factor RbfA [Chloroflexota bacterium]
MGRRIERLANLIQEEVSDLLKRGINDPRLAGLISVTRVSLTADLKHTVVFVSVLGDADKKRQMLAGFTAASGFMRRQLADRLNLRRMPTVEFRLDESIEEAAKVLEIIDRVSQPAKPSDTGNHPGASAELHESA